MGLQLALLDYFADTPTISGGIQKCFAELPLLNGLLRER